MTKKRWPKVLRFSQLRQLPEWVPLAPLSHQLKSSEKEHKHWIGVAEITILTLNSPAGQYSRVD